MTGWAQLLIWGPKSGRPALCQAPWSACALTLILQMSKAVGWDYSLGYACRDLVSWLLESPPSFSFPIRFPVVEPQISLQAAWGKARLGAPTKQPTMLEGAVCHPWALCPHWGNLRPGRDLSVGCCASLRGAHCGSAPLTLLTVCLSHCGARGCFSLILSGVLSMKTC